MSAGVVRVQVPEMSARERERIRRACVEEGLLDEDDLMDFDDIRTFTASPRFVARLPYAVGGRRATFVCGRPRAGNWRR